MFHFIGKSENHTNEREFESKINERSCDFLGLKEEEYQSIRWLATVKP